MQKRLGIGFLKGLVLGIAVGIGVELGLRWPTPSGGVLAYLFAMGVGGTAGVFGGRAPWKESAWLEALLKMVFGVGVGALLYWLGARYAPFELPWVGGSRPWTSIAPLYLPLIGAVYGAVVELDHDERATNKKSASSTRSSTGDKKLRIDPLEDTEISDADIPKARRR